MSVIRDILRKQQFSASAPCRIDMGGTLDLSTFFLPLYHLKPCTFNAAINLRTHVHLRPFDSGRIHLRSKGFDELVVDAAKAPFDHPMGLMLAVAAYFNADGVAIEIDSASPPRSALGGSSVAAVAMIWAFLKALAANGAPLPPKDGVARLAHGIEQSVAGVPCGQQDQLSAVYGGVNAWEWTADLAEIGYKRRELVAAEQCDAFSKSVLVAYCGRPHVSKDINGTWVRQFISGESRELWYGIVHSSRQFVEAIVSGNIADAQAAMNEDTRLRRILTPDVLDEVGIQLVDAAVTCGCGARFTGAGGGGCVWALAGQGQTGKLRGEWEEIIDRHPGATLLETGIDTDGVL
jgi:D-glycero-alpha-D-manno-heptose-7-phosphate kinase